MSSSNILYPNVTSLPAQSGVGPSDRLPKREIGGPGEFDQAFKEALSRPLAGSAPDLSQIKAPLKFSAHAKERLQDRKIVLDGPTMQKVNDAVDKAEAKGLDDALILTKDAALIVSVKNRTVITAVDRNQMTGNVFTNIDGAVVVQ